MKKVLIISLFVFLSFFDAYVYAQNISEELFNNVIRLHVIADDDSEEAQRIKLKVRDGVLEKIKSEELYSYEATCEYVKNNINELEKCVYEILSGERAGYSIAIDFEETNFPTKCYENLIFPKGKYEALRIKLGDAKGKNWWCVMYPTLCFTNEVCEDSEACKKLRAEVSAETFAIVAGEAKFKFKILEFFAK